MVTYYNDFMNSFLFGQSENGLAIDVNIFGNRGKHVFILGGVHGESCAGLGAGCVVGSRGLRQWLSLI